MQRKLNWVESAGGPLIFVPRSIVTTWRGIERGTSGSGSSDYSRACAVSDEIGVIAFADSDIIVLGDEPDRTTIITRSPNSALIIRWRWADGEDDLLKKLDIDSIFARPMEKQGEFVAEADEYWLFDSSFAGSEVSEVLKVFLANGKGFFASLEFRPDDRTSALLHRIEIGGE